MKKKAEATIRARSVVKFPSHPNLMTVEAADYMTGRAKVVWFNRENVLMTANIEIASLQLVRP